MFSARRSARGGVAWSAAALPPIRIAVAALLLVGATSAVAAAQPAGAPPEAIEFYRQAREHFESGSYAEAAAALEQARAFDPDSPTLAYNLARVYELMGDLDRALEQYERYQTLLPQQQAREQEQADSTIRRLQGALANRGAHADEATPAPPEEVEPLRQLPGIVLVRESGVADAGFWGTLSAGLVALAVGGIFGGLALDARNGVDDFVLGAGSGPQQRADLQNQAELFGVLADVSLGVGGAAVIVAAILYFAREHTVERAPVGARDEAADAPGAERGEGPEVGVEVDGASARLTLGGRF